MYGIFTYIWVVLGVNVGKYTIHGCYGEQKSTLTNKHLAKHHGIHVVRFDTFLLNAETPFWWIKKPTQLKHVVKFDHPPKDLLVHIKHGPSALGNDLYQKNINNHFLHEETSIFMHFRKKKRNRDIQLISTGQCSAWHSNWQLVLACTNSFLISDNAFDSWVIHATFLDGSFHFLL